MQFKDISIADKKWMQPLFEKSGYMGADCAFGTNFIWSGSYNIRVLKYKDFVLKNFGTNGEFYSFPIGTGDLRDAIDTLIADAKSKNKRFKFNSLTEHMVKIIDDLMPGKFDFKNNRDIADYIYSVSDLANLSGKKYHSKRNHISKFMKKYSFDYFELSDSNIDEFRKLSDEWFLVNEDLKDDSIKYEKEALSKTLENYEQLGIIGALIKVENKPIAMSIGERINSETFLTHFEKALTSYDGSYALINKEFASRSLSNYKYVNREEDMGMEGLRKAKLSYRPEILLEKYEAVLRD